MCASNTADREGVGEKRRKTEEEMTGPREYVGGQEASHHETDDSGKEVMTMNSKSTGHKKSW